MFHFYAFASCSVIRLCNINQRNAHFSNEYFNSIFQFLTFSTFLEPYGIVLRKTFVNADFVWYVYMRWCKQLDCVHQNM